MLPILTAIEARVLACLIEKEKTTPDYYPLTLASLTAACNQKSNRAPVMSLPEEDVAHALDTLKDKHLAWEVAGAGARVPKYRHRFTEQLPVDACQVAVLCELMVRGPQTAGELRMRAPRIEPAASAEAVAAALTVLAEPDAGPCITLLPREPGKREPRYAHLLCGPVEPATEPTLPAPEPARVVSREREARLAALEADVASLREELAALRSTFDTFRRAFE